MPTRYLTRRWRREIHGYGTIMKDDELSLEEKMRRIVALFKADEAYGSDDDFTATVEELDAYAGDGGIRHFDEAMNELYDWADEHRVWIDPLD